MRGALFRREFPNGRFVNETERSPLLNMPRMQCRSRDPKARIPRYMQSAQFRSVESLLGLRQSAGNRPVACRPVGSAAA